MVDPRGSGPLFFMFIRPHEPYTCLGIECRGSPAATRSNAFRGGLRKNFAQTQLRLFRVLVRPQGVVTRTCARCANLRMAYGADPQLPVDFSGIRITSPRRCTVASRGSLSDGNDEQMCRPAHRQGMRSPARFAGRRRRACPPRHAGAAPVHAAARLPACLDRAPYAHGQHVSLLPQAGWAMEVSRRAASVPPLASRSSPSQVRHRALPSC